jgi:hypothetical protein
MSVIKAQSRSSALDWENKVNFVHVIIFPHLVDVDLSQFKHFIQ